MAGSISTKSGQLFSICYVMTRRGNRAQTRGRNLEAQRSANGNKWKEIASQARTTLFSLAREESHYLLNGSRHLHPSTESQGAVGPLAVGQAAWSDQRGGSIKDAEKVPIN